MGRQCDVLVVDDDEDIREALGEILVDNGFRVSIAGNGQEAINLLRNGSHTPGVILLDLMMPVMDGRTFRKHQLEDASINQIPVVVMSAFRDGAERAEDLAATAFLKKPLNIRELVSILSDVCA